MKKPEPHKSISHAINGVVHAISTERNIKIQAVIATLLIITAFILKIPKLEGMIFLFAIFLVIIIELVNTAFERLIDKLHPDFDKKIGKVKDMMSGAVLISGILAIIIIIMILKDPIMALF